MTTRRSKTFIHTLTTILTALVLCTPATAAGQGTGVIAGRVTDPTGAPVPGATMTAEHDATGVASRAVTTTSGYYAIVSLPPGAYRVSTTMAGFRAPVRERVIVNVETRSIVDVVVRPAGVAEAVTVEGTATLVDRLSPAVGTVVDRQFVENLPLNGRSFQTLLEITPGVTLARPSITSTGQFSVAGQRTNANYFTVDGVGANVGTSVNAQFAQQAAGSLPALTVSGGTNALVSVDALEEFKVQTSSYAPEFGRTPGGQVSLVTRSGTNRLSGALFDYVRHDALDENDWFNRRDGIEKLKLRQQQFGGVIGGPIRTPGYDGRGRSFFFLSYEGLRLTQPQDVTYAVVPSVAARQQATGIVRDLFNAFPLPNAPAEPGDPVLMDRYRLAVSSPSRFDATSLRLDHRGGTAWRLFGRANHAPSSNSQRSFANGQNAFELTTTTTTVGSTWTPGPRVAHDTRLNYSRSRGLFEFNVLPIDGAIIPDLDVLYPLFASRASSRVNLQLTQAMPFQPGRSAANFTIGKSLGNSQAQWNLVHTTTVVAGAHELKAGFDWRRLHPGSDFSPYSFAYVFRSVEEALATGIPVNVSMQAFAPETRFRVQNVSLFLQDVWRATPRLTLTYGARYELNPPPSGDPLLPYTFDGLDDPLTMTLASQGTRFYETTRGNVAPRVGVAYLLSERRDVVLRGGWGVYYDLGSGPALRGYTSFPYNSTRSVPTPGTLPLSDAVLTPAPFNEAPPFTSSFNVAARDLALPYTHHWNASMEMAIGARDAVTVGYIGSAGRRLLKTEILRNQAANAALGTPAVVELNPALFANTATVSLVRNESSASYHALQVQYQRRLHRGVQALVSYTLGRSMDDISDETVSSLPSGGVPGFLIDQEADWGPSDFDVRHAVVGSVTWNLPSPAAGVGRTLLGGWGLDLIGRYRSGMPITVITTTVDPLNIASSRRVDVVAGQPFWIDDDSAPGGRRLNPDAFAVPTVGRQGTLARNSIRGFPLRQLDLSLRRRVDLTGPVDLTLRIDAFNVLNTTNFADPGGSFNPTSSTFGRSTSTAVSQLGGTSSGSGLNQLYQVGRARSLQVSLRLGF
ncbi:MAG: hypothetical protein ABS36_18175 [Acidobacteria bacterium SCN 69-37]|nr:MAG: hypothetical protein ABS36_18175 [Acidobacteria bacterium SCN 69-37]